MLKMYVHIKYILYIYNIHYIYIISTSVAKLMMFVNIILDRLPRGWAIKIQSIQFVNMVRAQNTESYQPKPFPCIFFYMYRYFIYLWFYTSFYLQRF